MCFLYTVKYIVLQYRVKTLNSKVPALFCLSIFFVVIIPWLIFTEPTSTIAISTRPEVPRPRCRQKVAGGVRILWQTLPQAALKQHQQTVLKWSYQRPATPCWCAQVCTAGTRRSCLLTLPTRLQSSAVSMVTETLALTPV